MNVRCLVILLALLVGEANASVPAAYRYWGDKHGIQPALLYAIALVESRHTVQGHVGPWPWTLNISGQPFYFASRKQAYTRLWTELHVHQNEQVAIGPMQVFWRYNKGYFANPWEALDPYRNIEVGALIFNAFYQQRGSIKEAIGAYHSPNKSRPARYYRKKVCTTLQEISRGPHEDSVSVYSHVCAAAEPAGRT